MISSWSPEFRIGDLAALLDPAAGLALLRAAGLPVRASQVTYLRVKPPDTAIVGLELTGEGAAGSEVRMPGYARTFADDRARLLAEKWTRMKARPSALGPGYLLLPGARTVLFLFPNDARLRGLRFVAEPRKLRLRLIDLDGIGNAGWQVAKERATVEPVRYKPERRFVARVRVFLERSERKGAEPKSAENLSAFLRFFRDSRGLRLEATARSLLAGPAGARVPRPLGTILDGRAYLEEDAQAPEIVPSLLLGKAPAEEVARAVLDLHASEVPGLRHLPPRRSFALTALTIHNLEATGLLGAGRARRLLERLGAGIPAGAPRSTIHGDLHLHQILLRPGGPLFVDLERFATGDPLHDVGSLVAHLVALADHEPASRDAVLDFKDRFVEAYRVGSPRRPSADLAFFVAQGLVELALLRFRQQGSGWAEAASRALTLADETVG